LFVDNAGALPSGFVGEVFLDDGASPPLGFHNPVNLAETTLLAHK
jgi:hypothetical protein